MPIAVRKFTKDNPCTKRDLWSCFMGETGFRTVLVPEAQSVIGVNAPRVMERNGYLTVKSTPRGDYYTLTSAGRDWLQKGILAYVKNHPTEARSIANLPGAAKTSVRIRRTR